MRRIGSKQSNKPSLALRAAAIQQHMATKIVGLEPMYKPKSPKKIIKKPQCNCSHHHKFDPIPTSTIFESNSVKDKRRDYEKGLSLAEKLGIVEPPPAPLSDEQFETVKIEAQKRGFFNETCPICLEKFGPDNLVLLSCSHLLHATCLMNFRKFTRGKTPLCPVCRQPYEFVEVKAQTAYHERCAVTIQRVVRGWLLRRRLGDLAPQGTELHRKWVLGRAAYASDRLVDAVDKQSDAIDAVLGSIDHDLEWARNVMRAVEERGRVVDWCSVKEKAKQRCGDCPVCLRQMKPSDASVTSCGHVFHTQCLASWIAFCSGEGQTPSCPVCRQPFQHERMESPQKVEDGSQKVDRDPSLEDELQSMRAENEQMRLGPLREKKKKAPPAQRAQDRPRPRFR